MNKFKLTTFLTLAIFAFVSLLFLTTKSVFACTLGDYKTVCVHPGQERVYQCDESGTWQIDGPQANPDCMKEAPAEVQDEKNYNPEKPPAGTETDKNNDCLTGKAASDQCGYTKGTPEYDAAEAARLRTDINTRLPKTCSPGDFYTSCSGPDAEDVWTCNSNGTAWARANRQTNVNCTEKSTSTATDNKFNPAAQEGAALKTKAKIESTNGGCWAVGNNTQSGGDTACGVAYGGMSQCDKTSGRCKAPQPGWQYLSYPGVCTDAVKCPYGGKCTSNSQCIDNMCGSWGVCIPKNSTAVAGDCPMGNEFECPSGYYCNDSKKCTVKSNVGNCCSAPTETGCIVGQRCGIESDSRCLSGYSCQKLGSKGTGTSCESDGECVSSKCEPSYKDPETKVCSGGAAAVTPTPAVTYSTCVAGCEQGANGAQCRLDCKSNCVACLKNGSRVTCEPVCGSAIPVVPPVFGAAPAAPTTPEQKNCMTKCVRDDGDPWNVCLKACFPQLPKLDLPIGSLANGDACSRELIAGTVKSNGNLFCQSGRCGDNDKCESATLPGGDVAGAATRESLKLVCRALGFDGDTCDKASTTVGDVVKNKIDNTSAPVVLIPSGSLPPGSGCWGPSPVNLYCSSGICSDGECGDPISPAKVMSYLGCKIGGATESECRKAAGTLTTGDITVPKSQPQYIPVVTPGTLGGDCSQPCGKGMSCSSLMNRCVIDFRIWK